MAFAYTRDKTWSVAPGIRESVGTFTNAATDSGGAITTGLKFVRSFHASTNSHVNSHAVKYTVSGGTVTIVTDDGVDGTWRATGL